ncbi:hypothetical protein GCM10009565_47840 [Amycolatopsis albidoflavus]
MNNGGGTGFPYPEGIPVPPPALVRGTPPGSARSRQAHKVGGGTGFPHPRRESSTAADSCAGGEKSLVQFPDVATPGAIACALPAMP